MKKEFVLAEIEIKEIIRKHFKIKKKDSIDVFFNGGVLNPLRVTITVWTKMD